MRLRPNIVISAQVQNRSTRGGVRPVLIVLHSTESHQRPGNADLQAIVGWFNNPAAQASSHVVTDADGNSARCVPDNEKAWTCAGFNAVSLNIEQIGFASQSVWLKPEQVETARWIARWSQKYGIPIERGAVSGSSVTRKGVVTHAQLGSVGGNHHDPGPSYPIARVLRKAKRIKRSLP